MKSSSESTNIALLALVRTAVFIAVAFATSSCLAQTFEIGGQSQPAPQTTQQQRKAGKSAATAAPAEENSLQFGSSIEATRQQRAADEALRHNNAPAAYEHAKRAVEMAPGDRSTWFTLGYAARLSGHLSDSERAYKKGLQLSPNSPEGMSGLAQTYFRQGRVNDAKRMLLDLIQKYPNRIDDQMMAGELFMQSGDTPQALQILQHAEQIKPSAHAELLMAIGYMKQHQTARAK